MKSDNTPIKQLMDEEARDGFDYQNREWLCKTARRYVETMSDSQVRCLLYAMADEIERLTRRLDPSIDGELRRLREKERHFYTLDAELRRSEDENLKLRSENDALWKNCTIIYGGKEMSDTPRTDAVTFSPELMRLNKTVGVPVEVTPAETSRQLERELTAAKAEIERLTRENDRLVEMARECDICEQQLLMDRWAEEHPAARRAMKPEGK